MFSSVITILFAIAGGVAPALVWLWFWLREDQKHPEPPKLLIISFVLGMVAVGVAIPLEKLATSFATIPLAMFAAWSLIEEGVKYLAAYIGGMHTQAEDEPIDAMIYLITAALGFAAAENTLFILQALTTADLYNGLITLNIRFIGTTLLHILASGTMGAWIAFSFYKNNRIKHEHFVMGLISAVVLHTIFNFLILHVGTAGIFAIFACVWILIIGLLLLFESVKRIRRISL